LRTNHYTQICLISTKKRERNCFNIRRLLSHHTISQ